jgi:hypothetical protein
MKEKTRLPNLDKPREPPMEEFVKGWPVFPYAMFLAWAVGMCMGMWVTMPR